MICEIEGIGLDYGQISELVLESITAHEAQLKKEGKNNATDSLHT